MVQKGVPGEVTTGLFSTTKFASKAGQEGKPLGRSRKPAERHAVVKCWCTFKHPGDHTCAHLIKSKEGPPS